MELTKIVRGSRHDFGRLSASRSSVILPEKTGLPSTARLAVPRYLSPVELGMWESLSAIQLDGQAPTRFQTPIYVLGGLGIFIFLALAVTIYRTVSAALRYQKAAKSSGSSGRRRGKDGWTVSPTGSHKLPAKASESSESVEFEGDTEVTKASAHARPVRDNSKSGVDEWDLDDEKNQAG